MSDQGPPPPVRDHDSVSWWDAVADDRLVIQQCDGCQTLRWPPRAICGNCGSMTATWTQVSGSARVVSWVVARRQYVVGRVPPYTTVAAALEEQQDIVILGGWGGNREGRDLAIGQPVIVGFEHLPGGDGPPFALLRWSPTAA